MLSLTRALLLSRTDRFGYVPPGFACRLGERRQGTPKAGISKWWRRWRSEALEAVQAEAVGAALQPFDHFAVERDTVGAALQFGFVFG